MRPGETKLQIVTILYSFQEYFIRSYTYLARDTILEQLKRRFNKTLSLSGLDKALKGLSNDAFFKPFRRRGQAVDGTWFNMATNRRLTIKGLLYLRKIGVRISDKLIKWARHGMTPEDSLQAKNLRRALKESQAQVNRPLKTIREVAQGLVYDLDSLKLTG